MQCGEVRAFLLDDVQGADVDAHLAGCDECRGFARRNVQVDGLLRSALVVVPPMALQASLASLVQTVAAPAPVAVPAPAVAPSGWAIPAWLWTPRTPMGVAQLLALFSTVLASRQVFTWLGTFTPVLGDIPYAWSLLVSSPAIRQIGEVPLDIQGLMMWSLIAVAGWALSESGPLGRPSRRLA